MSLAVVGFAASGAVADLHDFPSATSTVVGSVGFVDADEVGYFWSVARGDLVSETFADSNASVTRAIIAVDVPFNGLASGLSVNWDVTLNGTLIDSFSVPDSFLGTVNRDVTFAAIAAVAGAYDVEYRVTNEIPGGDGSHTFAYGDRLLNHSIELIPTPGAAALLGLGALAAGRRRR